MTQTGWQQQLLVAPEAVEVRISLGFVPERDHAQAMVEAFDPSSKAVLAMWSRHHFAIADWPAVLEEAVVQANLFIGDLIEPF